MEKNPGTFSKPRATKTRVVWDYMTPDGRKGSLSQSKRDYLMDKKTRSFGKIKTVLN